MRNPESGPVIPSPAAEALCGAIIPPGQIIEGLGRRQLLDLYRELGRFHHAAPLYFDRLCRALDLLALPRTGRRFQDLAPEQARRLLARWNTGTGAAARALSVATLVTKLFYFDRPELFEHFGVPYDKSPATPEPIPRYVQDHTLAGHEVAGEELEADVVVVGAGAAGAIVAKELAQRGHAVILVEAGGYFRREDFTGRMLPALRDFYFLGPQNVTLGNVTLPVAAGRTVGGSTTINTATCFRPLPFAYRQWEQMGLPELSEQSLAPYFDDVEATLQVAPTKRELWGPHVELMHDVLDRLGYSHGPIARNAPECDGQNSCDMGCPSGGKYSQDRAYVPLALKHGALLLIHTSLEQLLIRHRCVRGVVLESGGRRFTVRAPRVVLCCGTLTTPPILWRHDLGGPAVGRNLTIHPSGSVSARFPQELRGFGPMVPSSHYVDEFAERGYMLISANLPLDVAALPLQLVGQELVRELERYQHFGSWGVLLAESSRGRLRRLPGGRVVCTYSMNRDDVRRIQEALAITCEMYLEAGAEAVYPAVRRAPVVRDHSDLRRFRAARSDAADLILTAYHPLGTCRMGHDRRTSVVDPSHRVRGVRGLWIADGSVVPGPIGTNSQMTVMAFARRAADLLLRALEE